ncbi:DUF1801 domain-containing protein [Thalassotalea fusca]
MTELKTQENDASVEEFIRAVEHPQKQADSFALVSLIEKLTDKPAKMWGNSIIGFGKYHYENTCKGGSWPIVGFSPRKSAISVYIMPGFSDYQPLLDKLGKHKTGKSCLYINKLADVDMEVLKLLIIKSIEYMKSKYRCD